MPPSPLSEAPVNIRVRLVGLWLAVTSCYLYGDYFELYTPGKVERLLNGTDILDSPAALLLASLVMVSPAFCVALSLLAEATIARWTSVICGTLFTVMMLAIAAGSLVEWYSFYVFLAVSEAILTAIIVVQAYRWPREVAV